MLSFILYSIWILLPLALFIISISLFLEKISKKSKRNEYKNYLRQAIFVSICSLIAYALDMFLTPTLYESLGKEYTYFIRIIYYPLILFIAAIITGGTKPIKIDRKLNRWSRMDHD